ncbi:MAG: hypothetical protein M0C28_05845 [Candidatus Moduliflexus flocculans]|nr:hypothetical protein [Candidatus Moduliflexus flocculans]
MRVVVVDPGEEPARGRAVEPAREPAEGLLGPALGVGALERRVGLEGVVVDVEAPAEAEAGVDREGRDEGAPWLKPWP